MVGRQWTESLRPLVAGAWSAFSSLTDSAPQTLLKSTTACKVHSREPGSSPVPTERIPGAPSALVRALFRSQGLMTWCFCFLISHHDAPRACALQSMLQVLSALRHKEVRRRQSWLRSVHPVTACWGCATCSPGRKGLHTRLDNQQPPPPRATQTQTIHFGKRHGLLWG